jgi:hypothetical protein
MIRFYSPLIISLVFISCAGTRVSYLGSSSAPTSKVDVYVDASSIKRPYTIMGKGYPEYNLAPRNRMEKTQEKALQKARMNGADAILFQDYYFLQDGTSIHSIARTDSIGKGLVTEKNMTVSPIISSRTDILFLKYK